MRKFPASHESVIQTLYKYIQFLFACLCIDGTLENKNFQIESIFVFKVIF